jgi:hypothetical protein
MEAFGAARRLVQLGFLCAWQKAVTVLDRPRDDGQTVGFEFRQADDDIGVQHNP